MSPVAVPCLLLISILGFQCVPIFCYSNGKVSKVCGSMVPHHSGHGQTSPSPYHLQTNTTTFSPNDRIQVILSGSSPFEGFLLQARDAASPHSAATIGTFTLTNPGMTQLLTCNSHQGSAVSHTSDVTKTEVVVIWNAPADAPSHVQFFVSVVAHYSKFWVKLPGPIINEHNATPLPTQSSTTPPLIPVTTHSVLPGPFTSEGCGQTKSCLLDPPGCDPQDSQCLFLSMTTEGPDQTSVRFELSGPAEGYVAFALSWDTMMGNDDVYLCIKDGDSVSVSAAFVSGRTYPEDQSQADLSAVSWRLADGSMQCRFSRLVKMSSPETRRFSLDQEYFLFLANGHAQHGKIWKHNRQPLISTEKKLIIGPPEVLRGSRGPTLLKIHGALMLLAWMVTGSVGTVIASFYKPDWPHKTLFGQKVWFQLHRGLMMLTVTLTIAAFCLPFFYRKGWSKHAGVHPYLGCCVLALSLTQPIMAVMRPSPNSRRRFFFNWAHAGVGYVAEILAVAAMFLGIRHSSLLLPQPWTTHVLIGYVAWLATFRVLLFLHKHFYGKRSPESEDTQCILSSSSLMSRWGPIIKLSILALLALGNVGLLVTLLIAIVEI
ncbi:putative ferric-chelate reductase 1 [Takifugu flavidus]|uniref:putative ferric-chelate reductase 1 n=1 Tax=Takifugu flavidus TaxID=433684 RepID=UPI002544BB31|nr:putative ferric-chelate reductase 1 [Takifugu flavidus]XP_056912614.1 putative ferric-chelate reductase 1 [Takifugu flavidus]XP_056912615.1 putative ferric-chelate reductase 1 [Takifugu flavidus]XP_056912616.1 putative ferric-chelate reductase 1 [Takifugu flavidus]